MYRGFDISFVGQEVYDDDTDRLFEIGERQFDEYKKKLAEQIEGIKLTEDTIDGSGLSADWFPLIEADVFISHAHIDNKLAITLAGYLKQKFGLTSFIDSCVWGYSDELLRLLDNEYCRRRDGRYRYEDRNRSTAHIHVMLAVALARMMNNCEAVFFLNTPKSVMASEYIEGPATYSPWIFSEIAMTTMIQRRPPSRTALEALKETVLAKTLGPPIAYQLDLNHLTKLDGLDFVAWEAAYDFGGVLSHPLDILYRDHPESEAK